MTLPDRSLRKEATATLNCFRGNEAQAGQLALSSANAGGTAMAALSTDDLDPDSVVFRDDLDRFVHHCESSTFGTSSIFQRRPVGRPSTTKEKDGWADPSKQHLLQYWLVRAFLSFSVYTLQVDYGHDETFRCWEHRSLREVPDSVPILPGIVLTPLDKSRLF